MMEMMGIDDLMLSPYLWAIVVAVTAAMQAVKSFVDRLWPDVREAPWFRRWVLTPTTLVLGFLAAFWEQVPGDDLSERTTMGFIAAVTAVFVRQLWKPREEPSSSPPPPSAATP